MRRRPDKRQLALLFEEHDTTQPDAFNLEDLPPAPILIESQWLQTFWLDLPPNGSRIDDMTFQVKRDLAALKDGPDEFLEERVARYRATILELMKEEERG